MEAFLVLEHILVVEDDPSISEWVSDYLTGHGYEVSVANRGDAAVELIAQDQPDLVLLDILLPEKNGFEVCREVRELSLERMTTSPNRLGCAHCWPEFKYCYGGIRLKMMHQKYWNTAVCE